MWLLKHEAALELRRACEAGLAPTAEQRAEFIARAGTVEALGTMPRNMKVAGDVAEIRVEGVLTQKPDFFAWLFGGGNTTYEQIQSALAIASADPNIKRVVMSIDSPGGHVHGLFDTLAALEAFSKPISATASMADSAAFAIAALSGKIEATNAAAEFGSVGVAASFFLDEDVVDITSTDAPKKRPDLSTEEGKAVIREELDAIHELFADAIARGRGTTLADVNKNFGRGATLLAGDAKKRGMIDSIAKPALRAVDPSTSPEETDDPRQVVGVASIKPVAGDAATPPKKARPMDLETLKKEHPETYAAACKVGESQERDRVCGHLQMAEASGDTKTAIDAIKSGEGMTITLQAKYMSAAMNRASVTTRQAESDAAGAVVDAAAPVAAAKPAEDLGDRVVAAMKAQTAL